MGIGPLSDDETAELVAIVEDAQTECRRVFQDAAPDIAREIVKLAKFGSNERIKLQAGLHVLERALGRTADNPPKPVDDPFTELFKGMTDLLKNSPNTPETAKDLSQLITLADTVEPPNPAYEIIEPGKVHPTDVKHTGKMRDVFNPEDYDWSESTHMDAPDFDPTDLGDTDA